jgi:molybdate transport system ATP-binding protein
VHALALRGRAGHFELDVRAAWSDACAALFGASGSGKTTILESILGLRPDMRGEVTLAGKRLDSLPPHRRRLGWVPQDSSLLPHLTVRENILFSARVRRSETAPGIDSVVDALEIRPLYQRMPGELSGGERQRVAIARAVAARPRFFLLDEPLASIDRPLRARLVALLRALPRLSGAPMLLVTHDPLEVLAIAQQVFVVEDGRIVAAGEPRDVFASAASFGALFALTAENIFAVIEVDPNGPSQGILRVRTRAGSMLDMVAVPGFREPRRVAIRSEDILLARGEPEGLSAQNMIRGTIVALEPLGEQVHVRVRAGEDWLVKITERAAARLSLAAGAPVTMIVKAHSIVAVE